MLNKNKRKIATTTLSLNLAVRDLVSFFILGDKLAKMLSFSLQFLKFADYLGFKKCMIYELWNQQYDNQGEHGWHVHGHNYTGVYYLNFNKDCAKTRLLDPYTKKYFIDIETEEGDIIIFPSSVIHTSQVQKTNFLKTIVSFNISFDDIKKDTYKNINKEVKIIK